MRMVRRLVIACVALWPLGCNHGSTTNGPLGDSDGSACTDAGPDLGAIRLAYASCSANSDCALIDATAGKCIELPLQAVNAAQAGVYVDEMSNTLDTYCRCTNVRLIADGFEARAACWSGVCEPVATWTCNGTITHPVDGAIATCGGGVGFSEPSGAPALDIFLFDMDAFADPTLHISASWPGPPTLTSFPDGGGLPLELVDGGFLMLGLGDFSQASAVATLRSGGTYVLDRARNLGDLEVQLSFSNNVSPTGMLLTARLDPVDAGPDAGSLKLHVAY